MRLLPWFCLFLLPPSGVFGQSPDDSLTFEVASVRPHVATNADSTGSSVKGGPGTNDPERITISNRMLRTLIIEAYGIHGYQIEHPKWLQEKRFDIVAKVPPGATKEQAAMMMRNLLVDRFHLRIRREMRNLPVYELVIAKAGLKMKPSAKVPDSAGTADGSAPDYSRLKTGSDGFPQVPPGKPVIFTTYIQGKAKATCQRQPLAKIASWLADTLDDRPVIDRTGLAGEYDFSLIWSQDSRADSDVTIGLEAALEQQLGLKLEASKLPVEMLIVVSALQVPVEN